MGTESSKQVSSSDSSSSSDIRHALNVNETNIDLLDKQLATDVTFRFSSPDGSTSSDVRAHRCILMSRSEVFEAMFTSGMAESRDDHVINLQDIDPQTFHLMLRHIYGADIDITADNVLQLLYAARKYILNRLVDKCEHAFVSSLTVDNVCSVLEHADHFSLLQLESKCLSFIGEHMQAFIASDSFFQLSAEKLEKIVEQDRLEFSDEGEVYEACVSWARKQLQESMQINDPTDQQIRQQLGDVIYKIRFPTMRHGEFARLVGRSTVLTSEEKNDIYFYLTATTTSDTAAIQFDKKYRRFSTPRVLRFDISDSYTFACTFQRSSIKFQLSIDATLTAVGLCGGLAPSTHLVRIMIEDSETVIISVITMNMTSDGTVKLVKVPLRRPLKITADETYTVAVYMNGPDTYYGTGGEVDVHFYSNNTIRFIDDRRIRDVNRVAEGNIPALYFSVSSDVSEADSE